ncbi:MAG: hypothetical protein JSV05_09290 [Candidatus Bathyarchaeota archaeon]|nr:MAG: hypothetical protein JSV05_09290 [Candidatus Bathyarchaeota archaeon]
MIGLKKEKARDALVQGSVAIAAGVIIFTALFLPWLSTEYPGISGLIHPKDQAALVIPMTLILITVLNIFGGAIHILGYTVGIQLATVTSAIAFFISVMVIVITVASADNFEGSTLDLLIGPWISAAGSIFGAISSKLERN